MDERLGKFLSRECQSLFLSHELNAFLTSAWTAKCRSRYERMVCTIISAPLCMPMPKLVGKEEGVEEALAFAEVYMANSSGDGAADGNGTNVARLVLRYCDNSGCVEELVRYWVEGVGC